MRQDDGDGERRRCGLCRKSLRPCDSISVAEVGERCYRCFNEESAERLGIDFDNTPIAPIVVTDVDGVRHRFEIRSMLVGTGHSLSAHEVRNREAKGGYRFEILGDPEADAQDLFRVLCKRIRQGLSVRHVRQPSTGGSLRRRTGSVASSSGTPRQMVRSRSSSSMADRSPGKRSVEC
jgi:hypothetical protein